MIRRVVFDSSSQHKVYFRLLYETFATRGSASRETRVTKDEKKVDSRIGKALKAISDPIGDEPAEGEIDGRFRRLKPEGGSLELEQKPEFARLVKFCEDAQWSATITDVGDELEQFLDAAEKVEDDVAPRRLKEVG